jgi:predicted deacetylase
MSSAELIVSVSGIGATTRKYVESFAELMDERDVPLSLLVAPRLKEKYRLIEDEPTVAWLRARRDRGDAIVLHGYDQAATKNRRAEFAVLPHHEALLRLTAADRMMEQAGLRTRIFAAPRWIVSAGALAALPRTGFRVAASLSTIHDLERGTSVRSWVYGIGDGLGRGNTSGGDRYSAEPWWCRALVMGAGRVARRGGVLRLAVSARQLGKSGPRQAMLDAVDLALYHQARPNVYRWELGRLVHAA